MSAVENETLIRRCIDAENAGDLDTVLDCFADDVVFHPLHFQPVFLPDDPQGKDAVRQSFARNRTSAPDLHFTIDHLVAVDDRVAVFGTTTGTHEGTVFGEEPTHKMISFTVAELFRIAGGKIVEEWGLGDRAGFWQQLGILPPTSEILPMLRQGR